MLQRPDELQLTEEKQLLINFDDPGCKDFSAQDLFDLADPLLILRTPEGEKVERKSGKVQARDLGRYFSMWANTGPAGGLLVVGVEDDGKISGCSSLSERDLKALITCPNVYAPDARCEQKRIILRNQHNRNDFIIVFRVHFSKEKLVATSSGEYYMRMADVCKKLSPDEVVELKCDRKEINPELHQSTLEYPHDFSLEAISEFCESVRDRLELSHDQSDEDVLVQRKLGKFHGSSFRPFITCALLFAKQAGLEIPGCRVHFLRFSGKAEGVGDQWNAIKDIWIDATVPLLIQRTAAVIESQLREFSIFGKDGKFTAAPEYPKGVWMEALVNACCHRSYSFRNQEIVIKMFDDRLVFESPGGFPPSVTPQNIFSSRYPRNPNLMDALLYFKYVKCSNEGARRMLHEMRESKLPDPAFAEIGDGLKRVRVTLSNMIDRRQPWSDQKAFWSGASGAVVPLGEDERRLMTYATQNEQINISDAARVAGVSWPKAKSLLSGLEAKGLLKHVFRRKVPKDTKGHWILWRR